MNQELCPWVKKKRRRCKQLGAQPLNNDPAD